MARKKRVLSALDIVCPTCHGEGTYPIQLVGGKKLRGVCGSCHGSGITKEAQSRFEIVKDGQSLSVREKGLPHEV